MGAPRRWRVRRGAARPRRDVELGWAAATIAAFGGVWVVVHELRRRERRVTRREIDDLVAEVHALRALLLEQRRHIYALTVIMIDAGLTPPPPPAPGFDPDEYGRRP